MYLKVQYNNSIKNYTLTDNYNKPYIKVNGSIYCLILLLYCTLRYISIIYLLYI